MPIFKAIYKILQFMFITIASLAVVFIVIQAVVPSMLVLAVVYKQFNSAIFLLYNEMQNSSVTRMSQACITSAMSVMSAKIMDLPCHRLQKLFNA